MKKLMYYLMVVYVPLLPLSGYAHVHPKPSDNVDSSREINNFSLGPQEILAVEEKASQIKSGLEHLGAGDIQGVFVLPKKESVSSESAGSEGTVRVAFLDTAKKCFMYDSMTKEMVLCDEESAILVRDSEEVLVSSLSSYVPVDSSFIPVGSLQTAGLKDFICTYETQMKVGGALGITLGILGEFVRLRPPLLLLPIATGGLLAGLMQMIIEPSETREIARSVMATTASVLTGALAIVVAGKVVGTVTTTAVATGTTVATIGALATSVAVGAAGVAGIMVIGLNSLRGYDGHCPVGSG